MKKFVCINLVFTLILLFIINLLQSTIALQSLEIKDLKKEVVTLKQNKYFYMSKCITLNIEKDYYKDMFYEVKTLPKAGYMGHLWDFLHKYQLN